MLYTLTIYIYVFDSSSTHLKLNKFYVLKNSSYTVFAVGFSSKYRMKWNYIKGDVKSYISHSENLYQIWTFFIREVRGCIFQIDTWCPSGRSSGNHKSSINWQDVPTAPGILSVNTCCGSWRSQNNWNISHDLDYQTDSSILFDTNAFVCASKLKPTWYELCCTNKSVTIEKD